MAKTAKPKRLGKGLSGLINQPVSVEPPAKSAPATATDTSTPTGSGDGSFHNVESMFKHLNVSAIVPNRHQPRQEITKESLRPLVESIRQSGLMQPVVVRGARNGVNDPESQWELIAGERRWRAAREAGLEAIPAIVMEASEREAAELAIVENLQREDLNVMDRADALRNLQDTFALTHGQIAERVALNRSSVANLIRLTDLESPIRELLAAGELGAGHGKALLALDAGEARVKTARRAARSGWSVRKLESFVNDPPRDVKGGRPAQDHASQEDAARDLNRKELERRLGEALGTRVSIKTRADGRKGHLKVEFYDLDHFDDLLNRFGVAEE